MKAYKTIVVLGLLVFAACAKKTTAVDDGVNKVVKTEEEWKKQLTRFCARRLLKSLTRVSTISFGIVGFMCAKPAETNCFIAIPSLMQGVVGLVFLKR